jgi:ArsR family transcriptional regulator
MLGMMADGRGCCALPDLGVPAREQDKGICVCEFEDYFGMGQSKVSYHVRKLKEADLSGGEAGKWSFYSLRRDSVAEILREWRRTWGPRCPSRSDASPRFRPACTQRSPNHRLV